MKVNRLQFVRLLVAVGSIALCALTAARMQALQQTPTTNTAGVSAALAQLGSVGVSAHDPSTIVKDGGEYWVFYTGRGIPSYHSSDLVHWERGPQTILNAAAWATEAVPGNRGMDYWAPDVRKVGDEYFLYYSISTFGQRTSAIGLITNRTLDPGSPNYKWIDKGLVVQTNPQSSNYNAIDPSVVEDVDGGLWLTFGSFWEGIKLIQLDRGTGKRIAPDSPMYSLAHNSSIEASTIYYHDGQYYLFVNWGRCCQRTNSTYNIRVGRSSKITGPYFDKNGQDMMHDGGTLLLATEGAMIGPGHAGILHDGDNYWMSFHFYDGSAGGASKLAIRPLNWDAVGWPAIGRVEIQH